MFWLLLSMCFFKDDVDIVGLIMYWVESVFFVN